MSDFTPKIMHQPGVPYPIQEQNLDQYLAPLSAEHLVRRQVADLRVAAAGYHKATEELVHILERNRVLEEEIRKLQGIPFPGPGPQGEVGTLVGVAVEAPPAKVFPKLPCPQCGKEISSSPGAWASHMRAKHKPA